MRPVVSHVSLFGVTWPVAGYGLCVAVAVVVGVLLWLRQATRAGLDPGATAALAGPTLGIGFLGAYVLSSLVTGAQTGQYGQAFGAPSVAFYGGALGGLAAAVLCCRAGGWALRPMLDAAVLPLGLAHAIGRLGCLLGGCCYGKPSALPWAVSGHPLAPMGTSLRHPVQLYEALGLLGLSVVVALSFPLRQRSAPGARFAAYVAGYALLRFTVEFLRGDRDRGIWALGLSTSQWLSVAILALLLLASGLRRWLPAPAAVR